MPHIVAFFLSFRKSSRPESHAKWALTSSRPGRFVNQETQGCMSYSRLMRLAAAIGVIAVAFAAAVYIHQRHVWVELQPCVSQGQSSGPPRNCTYGSVAVIRREHPSWEDPAAVGIAIGGIAVAAGILTVRRGRFVKPS